MDVTQILLYIFVLATALPVGWLLAWLCKDELVDGRKWFKIILCCLIVLGVAGLLVWRNLPSLLSLAYMILVALVSLWKAGDKRFVEKK